MEESKSLLNGHSHATPLSMTLIVMGPSACGKSEVASGLARRFQCPYLDGDSYHSKENIHKMENGISLTDEDRIPWLTTLGKEIKKYSNAGAESDLSQSQDAQNPRINVVLACSALKKFYRDILRTGSPTGKSASAVVNGASSDPNPTRFKVVFVFLDCSKPVLEQRILARKNHFMKVNLLDSQLATLENPCLDGNNEHTATIRVNGDLKLEEILEFTSNELKCMHNAANSSMLSLF